jgi:heptosyltransferase-1
MYAAGSRQTSVGPRILAIRLGSMGDIIHTLPAVATLKHSFPNSHLTWAVEPRWAVLLEDNPFLDELLLVERRTLRGIVNAWLQLRRSRFDWAVDFQGLLKSALVASLARPEKIFGFHQSLVRERLAAVFYSDRIHARSASIIDQNLELAAGAGASSIIHAFPLPKGRPEGALPPGDFILACPVGGWPGKQWPIEYYGALADRLRSELRVPLVLNGPPETASTLSKAGGVFCHYSSVAGLIHATRRALAVVGIDSGPLHLAAALQKPGVAIFGPTDPTRNGPYGNTITVLRSPRAVTSFKRSQEIHESMKEISVEAVFEALRSGIAYCHSTGSSA